jgi:putative endonuclease
MFYVYILFNKSADRYYVGYCSELESRLQKHNMGATSSTKPYRPWALVYYEQFHTKTEAIKREKEIKSMKSRRYLTTLINGQG